MAGTWDLLFSGVQKTWTVYFFGPSNSTIQFVCIGSGWLNSIPATVLNEHPMVLVSSKALHFCFHWGYTFLSDLPSLSTGTPILPHSVRPQLLSLTAFNPIAIMWLKSVPFGRLLHMKKFSFQTEMQPWSSRPRFCVLSLRNTPQKISP